MNLIRYNNPWNLLNTLQRDLYNPDFNRLNEDDASVATANWAPSVDISENEKNFTLLADIPGDFSWTYEDVVGPTTYTKHRHDEGVFDRVIADPSLNTNERLLDMVRKDYQGRE